MGDLGTFKNGKWIFKRRFGSIRHYSDDYSVWKIIYKLKLAFQTLTLLRGKSWFFYSKCGVVIVPASGVTAEGIGKAAMLDKSGILLGGD